MTSIDNLATKIRNGEPLPLPLAAALHACTPITRIAMWRRHRQKRHRVDARVISFGNITAGGTGKTPAVIERARVELAAGHRVAVLTRGYAAPSGTTPYESPRLEKELPYHALGDEAALILSKAPGVVILKNPDRVASAVRAIDEYDCNVLILDDGFQQLRLERDENIVMIDATNPFGSGHLIPRGTLREPLSALERATHLMITHADRARDLAAIRQRLAELNPHVRIRLTRHAAVGVRDLHTAERHPVEWLKGRDINLLCAISDPNKFSVTVATLGGRPANIVVKPNHAPIDHALKSIGQPVIITEKDAARLTAPPPPETYALEIELQDL